MALVPVPYTRPGDIPPYLRTTLYDLIAVLQDVVAPPADALVVAIVADWLRAGRITVFGATTSSRALWHDAALALL